MSRQQLLKSFGTAVFAVAISFVLVSAASAQTTFTNLFSFDLADGLNPGGGRLVQGADGLLYGTTIYGGPDYNNASDGYGTVYKMTTGGALATVYNFCSQPSCIDGAYPGAGLALGTNGNFYGTTTGGGRYNKGEVFELTPSGTLKVLHSFCAKKGCPDGSYPAADLILASDGNFYGTTGPYDSGGVSTIFRITPGGALKTLYKFGGLPPGGGLVQASNGNFYGTISVGDTNGGGAIYEMTPGGALTTLYYFCSQQNCTDGEYPRSGLVQASDGNLYGTTSAGGLYAGGTIYEISLDGTTFNSVYSFCAQSNCPDGELPWAPLISATDGNLYGTTAAGGSSGGGAIFQLTTAHLLTTLYSFCSQTECVDGQSPTAPLIQDTNGTLYGTTELGEIINLCACGNVFSLSVPSLAPFVETVPATAIVGAKVTIFGTNLTGTTRVSFNGVAAKFKVAGGGASIITHVPLGATTGNITVDTPSGSLTSNVPFVVVP